MRLAAYQDTARKLVNALREAISTDLSDAEEREVGSGHCASCGQLARRRCSACLRLAGVTRLWPQGRLAPNHAWLLPA